MIKALKINTAMLICFAFVFRLLFANISTAVAQSPTQQISNAKLVCNAHVKSLTGIEKTNNVLNNQNANVEFCEEETDDDEKQKAFLLTQLDCHLLLSSFNSAHQSTYNCYQSFCYSCSCRYLTLQVFRL